MESLKKYRLVISLLFAVIMGILSAKLVAEVIIQRAIKPPVVKIIYTKGPVKKQKDNRKNASTIIAKNIFNSLYKFGKKQIDAAKDDGKKEGALENSLTISETGVLCKESTIVAEIKGTQMVDPEEYSTFSVYDSKARTIRYYQLGDDFIEPNVTVYKIERSLVILDRKGIKEYLVAGKKEKKRRPKRSSKSNKNDKRGKANNRSGSRVGVRQTGPYAYEVNSEELDKELKNLNRISREARIIPYQKGDVQGFKVFAIKRGSLFEKIGVRNGDVFQSVNGTALTSPDKALEMYSSLMEGTSSVKLNLLRYGKKVSLDYSIK